MLRSYDSSGINLSDQHCSRKGSHGCTVVLITPHGGCVKGQTMVVVEVQQMGIQSVLLLLLGVVTKGACYSLTCSTDSSLKLFLDKPAKFSKVFNKSEKYTYISIST